VADQHGTIDERVIEHARDVIGEIYDADPGGVARWRRASVPTVMRVDTKTLT
jgi:hypothetical protein